MSRYAMAVDLGYCIGCYNCQTACKDEHVGNDFPPITKSQPTFGHFWMSINEIERVLAPSHIQVVYIPTPCQHCDDPACMKAAREDAIYKRPDGIVIIDPEKSKGRKELVHACPYGRIYWNEEANIPQKCTMCAHLLDDGWNKPRCVQSCPVSCLYFGDLEDPESKISRFLAGTQGEAFEPEKGTQPSMRYVGLPKPHLAGTVIFGDTGECAKAVKVTIKGPDGKRRELQTDFFGDFAFGDLEKAKYSLQLDANGYASQTLEIEISENNHYVGEVTLRPS